MAKFDTTKSDTMHGMDKVRELNLAELDRVGGGLGIGAGVSVTGLGGVVKGVEGLLGTVDKIAGGALGGIKL